jgi:spore germination protein GerM
MNYEFGVVTIINGIPGIVYMATNFDHAVNIAVKIAGTYTKLISEEDIRKEIVADSSWLSKNGDIWVYILPAEQYNPFAL